MLSRRLKVLVSAFAFSPYQGSEGGAGWHIVTRLARHHDVTVLVGDMQADLPVKRNLERWFESNAKIPNLEVIHVPPDKRMTFWERIHYYPGLWSLYYRGYALWQKKAYQVACDLHHRRRFDVCHQLTYLTYRDPGYLWKLGIPFYWGPVSGTDNVPSAFYLMLLSEEHGKIVIRDFLNTVQKHISFRARRAARAAKKVWCVSKSDLDLVGKAWRGSTEQLIETGADTVTTDAKTRHQDEALRMIWSGLHVARKALPLLLEALAKIPAIVPWHLEILGNGPSTERWKRLARELRLPKERILWSGLLAKTDALNRMKASHVLVHTSLREATSTVLMEALSFGLPVICHDACGMSVAINEGCGIKIPLTDPETSIDGFHDAIMKFIDHPELLAKFSLGALSRAKQLTWEQIALSIASSYSSQP